MLKRNQNIFEQAATIEKTRSIFDRNQTHKTTLNAGKLVPIYVDEILPGDTTKIKLRSIVRQSTMLKPVMDNSYIDTFYFFVPSRIVWDDLKKFHGQNDEDAWTEKEKPLVPQLKAPQRDDTNNPTGGWAKGTIADYMGIPTQTPGIRVNALPFRAYALIWNTFFRDQNTQTPIQIDKGSNEIDGTNGTDHVLDGAKGGAVVKTAKFHDYFTSALPEPQKGNPVEINLGGLAPVITGEVRDITQSRLGVAISSSSPMTGGKTYSAAANPGATTDDGTLTLTQVVKDTTEPVETPIGFEFSNLYADLSNSAATTINALREAFALQELLELDARGGTRYIEILKSHFGVKVNDARIQRPEYLGGEKSPLNIQQIAQTSGTGTTGEDTPQANLAAFGHTFFETGTFTKSFEEHGYIIGLATIRTEHSYQQGLHKMWSRRSREDFYMPLFANLGEQPILNKEIFATGQPADEEIFGYQEAWSELRYNENRISGAMRSNYAQSIDYFHYGDNFATLPILTSEFISETEDNINRTLAVNSSLEDQFIADFYTEIRHARILPVKSIPEGLGGHL